MRVRLVCGLGLALGLASIWARAEWVNGLSMEAPPRPYEESEFAEATASLRTNWVAVVPYGFIAPKSATVRFGGERQWWGESRAGAEGQIRSARELGQLVMLKPQVWLTDGTYTGELDFGTDAEWLDFERSYRAYLFHYLESDTCRSADALCIGTEWETSVRRRPEFWRRLIRDVRRVYPGAITYAANWDAYREPAFWEDLDAIGINAYFPVADGDWAKWKDQMESFAEEVGRPIVFTEFGYRSVEGTRDRPWEEVNGRKAAPNEQSEALNELFRALWNDAERDWFQGGFLWKWHLVPERDRSVGYTVQGKVAEEMVRTAYSRMAEAVAE